MARYHSDTESDSYRYDDNSSEELDTDLHIPGFDQKNATQIAEYLDSKLNNTEKRSVAVNTSVNGNQNQNIINNQESKSSSYQSPAPDRIWTPLSQSTPADISSTKTQPKDILKAKSRLSNLAVSAGGHDSTNDASDESDDSNEKLSQDTSFQDTPSKSSKTKPPSNIQAKSNPIQLSVPTNTFDKELKELKELRELKNYISGLPNGSLILDNFTSPQDKPAFDVYKVDDFEQKTIEVENFKQQIEASKKHKESYEEEVEIYKSSNGRLKEEIDILNKSNENLKKDIDLKVKINQDLKINFENSTEKLKIIESSNEKLEKELENVRFKLESVLGDPKEADVESKHPALQNKESNGKTIFENLEIDQINNLNLSKSHRLLKNILINLEIPLSQAKVTIPKIANLLQSEDILINFANKVHLLLYNKKLNIDKFQREKEGGQHLYQCTTQMYENIELLSKELSFNQ